MSAMSIRQFAKELGVTEKAIRKAIASGRIPKEAIGQSKYNGRSVPTIENAQLAARCYRAGTQHSKGHQAGKGNPATSETSKAVFAREMFRAKREQMKYEKESGLLVSRAKVILAIHAAIAELKPKRKKAELLLLDRIEEKLRAALDKTAAEVSGA